MASAEVERLRKVLARIWGNIDSLPQYDPRDGAVLDAIKNIAREALGEAPAPRLTQADLPDTPRELLRVLPLLIVQLDKVGLHAAARAMDKAMGVAGFELAMANKTRVMVIADVVDGAVVLRIANRKMPGETWCLMQPAPEGKVMVGGTYPGHMEVGRMVEGLPWKNFGQVQLLCADDGDTTFGLYGLTRKRGDSGEFELVCRCSADEGLF